MGKYLFLAGVKFIFIFFGGEGGYLHVLTIIITINNA